MSKRHKIAQRVQRLAKEYTLARTGRGKCKYTVNDLTVSQEFTRQEFKQAQKKRLHKIKL